jgi:glycosyltransferase involved in cell wall biosynthesis
MSLDVAARLRLAATLEYLEYDSTASRLATSLAGIEAARLLWLTGKRDRAFEIASRIHRSGGSEFIARTIERTLRRGHRLARSGSKMELWSFYDHHIHQYVNHPDAAPIVSNPLGLLGYRVLVLKSARPRERGVLVADYSYIFPLFAALFDIEAIAQRYLIVLEPSWRGLCTPDVLAYSRFDFPVLIQAVEPRDIKFINTLQTNLSTVPIAANWWIDYRPLTPGGVVTRDIDVIVVAAWSAVKRHWRLFRVLARLRRRGHRLRVALVGYPLDKTRAEIEAEAAHFGVSDQIELHERIPLADVGRLYRHSKLHVLWSRKEGANRAVIESLFADVPVVVRRGLSYGYHYPYINDHTGAFADEDELGDVLLEMIAARDRYRPREWALANMTCQQATAILEEAVRKIATAAGEDWTTGLTVKTSRLETQSYWNPNDKSKFEADYAFLAEQLRPPYRRSSD